jgi:hypothetical protein
MSDHVMNYIETEAPPELTLVQWRRSLATPRPRRRRLSLRTFVPAHRHAGLAIA